MSVNEISKGSASLKTLENTDVNKIDLETPSFAGKAIFSAEKAPCGKSGKDCFSPRERKAPPQFESTSRSPTSANRVVEASLQMHSQKMVKALQEIRGISGINTILRNGEFSYKDLKELVSTKVQQRRAEMEGETFDIGSEISSVIRECYYDVKMAVENYDFLTDRTFQREIIEGLSEYADDVIGNDSLTKSEKIRRLSDHGNMHNFDSRRKYVNSMSYRIFRGDF